MSIKFVTKKIKDVLKSNRYSVECTYCGSHVPDAEIDRANAYGKRNLQNISDEDISDAFNFTKDCGSEGEYIIINTLVRIAEKGFETPYENLSFSVHIW